MYAFFPMRADFGKRWQFVVEIMVGEFPKRYGFQTRLERLEFR